MSDDIVIHEGDFEDENPQVTPKDKLAAPEPFAFEGHTFTERDIALLLKNASAALRVIEYDVHRLWTLLLKGPKTREDYHLLLVILRSRGFNPLYPDQNWTKGVPRP